MIPFTQADFYRLSYTPYNSVVASFFVTQANPKAMRVEQDQEAAHRLEKLRAHPEMSRDWMKFLLWQSLAELALIMHIEEQLSTGDLERATSPDQMESIAWRICAMTVPTLGTWQASPRHPNWTQTPEGPILDIIPDGV